ncbi:MAG: hypothetical protein ACYDIC_17130 [Desulfobaccales bacterium]
MMLGKKILAGIFAAIVLLKLILLLIKPNLWIGAAEVVLEHNELIVGIYLALILITGYFIFFTLNLIDVAVVMLFTSLLTALALLPYSTALFKLREEISVGVGKSWLAGLIWGALAVAVLYKVFSPSRKQSFRD